MTLNLNPNSLVVKFSTWFLNRKPSNICEVAGPVFLAIIVAVADLVGAWAVYLFLAISHSIHDSNSMLLNGVYIVSTSILTASLFWAVCHILDHSINAIRAVLSWSCSKVKIEYKETNNSVNSNNSKKEEAILLKSRISSRND